LDSSVSRHG